MSSVDEWLPMSSAPRDGTRVIVTVRPAEQGPADVDLAYWAPGDRFSPAGWRAADSQPDCQIVYAEAELRGWMALPMPARRDGGRPAQMPHPYMGDPIEESGSGI